MAAEKPMQRKRLSALTNGKVDLLYEFEIK
jgi:hypothetical protein